MLRWEAFTRRLVLLDEVPGRWAALTSRAQTIARWRVLARRVIVHGPRVLSSWERMPSEVKFSSLEFASAGDLVSFESSGRDVVNRLGLSAVHHDALWAQLSARRWPEVTRPPRVGTARSFYMERARLAGPMRQIFGALRDGAGGAHVRSRWRRLASATLSG